MTNTPRTSAEAYREIVEAGDDESLRRRAAALIAEEPRTIHEVVERFDDHSPNSIRPRVTELVRMGCVDREGTRENPSGHRAYVHHVTELGERWLDGDADPEPEPPLSQHKKKVTDAARRVVEDGADVVLLEIAVERHDDAARRLDPGWEP